LLHGTREQCVKILCSPTIIIPACVFKMQVKMSGRSDCLFSANPFTRAGYGHISFDDCRKCKFLHFRQSCFFQPYERAGNVWYQCGSSRNKPGSLFFIDRQNDPWHGWMKKYRWGHLVIGSHDIWKFDIMGESGYLNGSM